MLSLLRPPPRDRRHCRAPRPRHGSAPVRHAAWHIFPALCGSPCFPGLSASRGTGHGKFRQGGEIRRCRLAVLPKIRARASLVARRRKACGCAEPGAFGPALNWHRALSQRSPTLIPRSLKRSNAVRAAAQRVFVPARQGAFLPATILCTRIARPVFSSFSAAFRTSNARDRQCRVDDRLGNAVAGAPAAFAAVPTPANRRRHLRRAPISRSTRFCFF